MMETSLGTRRSVRRRRGARLVAAMLPLPALMAPAPVHALTAISICSGGGARTITIPARDNPLPRPEDKQGCAHFLCPRERGPGDPAGDPADDDEE